MKPLAEQVFLGEIVFQSKIALLSANHLFSTHLHEDAYEAWRSIQSLLVSAGNISKILWPAKIYAARGKHLRELLKVGENNLLSDRKIRNHFEHYDERIEEWFEKPSSSVYQDWAFDSFPPVWGPKLNTRHRVYDPVTGVLTFRGKSIELVEVAKAIKDIQTKCRRFALV